MTEILTPEILVKNTPYFNYAFCLNRYNFLFEVKVVNFYAWENQRFPKLVISI